MIKKHKIISLLALFTLSCAGIFAESSAPSKEPVEPVSNSFGYVGVGLGPFPLPLPSFAGGYRAQNDHHGGDISASISTIVAITQIKLSGLYHYYFKPNLRSQFYIGGGVGVSTLWNERFHAFPHQHGNPLVSPEFVFGKQYKNEAGDTRFFQAQISWPTFSCGDKYHKPFFMPLLILTYGIGF